MHLQISESVAQFHDLRLLFVQYNSEFVAQTTNSLETVTQIFFARMNQISIIHVASVTAYAQLFLDMVVQPVRTGQRQYLADLTAKPQPSIAESVYKILCQPNQPFVRQLLLKDFSNHLMGDAVKELAEIKQQNIAFCSVPPIMPAKMNAKSSDGKVIPFVLDGCAIIINKGSTQNRHQ